MFPARHQRTTMRRDWRRLSGFLGLPHPNHPGSPAAAWRPPRVSTLSVQRLARVRGLTKSGNRVTFAVPISTGCVRRATGSR
jgi:hypothetical protein